MPNQWFKFKKFTIQQDRCAMKVGTDGVILGAWVNVEGVKEILDVGTGTGLIALMLAQRNPNTEIEAIEIDPDAYNQALQNVADSPYSSQIKVIRKDFRDFKFDERLSYDLIVCNPPYFVDSLKPENKKRSIARHSDTLQIQDIILGAKYLLKTNGRLALILPMNLKNLFITLALEHGFFLSRINKIRTVPGKAPGRCCLEFSRKKTDIREESLIIETEGRHKYSTEYLELTKDFYLEKTKDWQYPSELPFLLL